MNTDQSTNGSKQFLNFSDALNHLRWGDRIARRGWLDGSYVTAMYNGHQTTLRIISGTGSRSDLHGHELMAEDWYVLGDHQ